jgi:hypothetical protein
VVVEKNLTDSCDTVNDAELRKLHVEYQKLDADKSGELDLKEFTELLTNHIPVRPRTFPVFNPVELSSFQAFRTKIFSCLYFWLRQKKISLTFFAL